MGRSNNPAVQSNSGVKKQKWGRVFPPLFLKGQEMRPLPFQKQKNSRPITIQDGRKPANMAQEITSKYLPGVYIGKGPGEEGYALPPRRHALQFYHGGAGRFPSVLFLLRPRSITLRGRFFCFYGKRKQAGDMPARCGYRNCVPLISSLKVSPRWSAARLERIIRVRKISK